MSVSSVAIQFTIIDLLSKGIDRIRSRMAQLAKGNKDVQKSFDKMAASAKLAAVSFVATKELAKGVNKGVAAASSLQAEMLGTRAELAGSVKNVKALETGLKQVSKTAFSVQAWTPFDQGQIVALEKELLKAGAKIEAVTGKSGAAAAAAALGTYEDLDPAEMGKKLIGIATPFKLQADKFMDLADKISRASSASTVGAAEIAETAKYAAPAMSALNRSTDEMLVLSAMLAQRGVESTMAGTGLRQFFNAAAKHKVFRDAAGNLKPLAEITEILNENLKDMGEAERLEILTNIFDVRGAPVAMALMDTGAASFEAISRAMDDALPLSQKLQIRMQGLNVQWDALKGTSRSTLANLYQPALKPLTALTSKMNEFVSAIGRAAQESDKLGETVSGLSLGGLAVGGIATVGALGATGYYLKKTLKGAGGLKGLLGGMTSAAGGIVAGKAVEKATGVTPVFVTNWPATFGTGVGIAGGTAGGGFFGKLGRGAKKSWKWLAAGAGAGWGKLGAAKLALESGALNALAAESMGGIAAGGASTMAGAGALLLASGAAGYGIGTLLNKYVIDGTALGDAIGKSLNQVAAFFGSETSRQALEINMRIDEERRVTAETNSMDTEVNTTLRRGSFWATDMMHP